MTFKDSHQKINKAMKYIQKVISYACIVLLVLIAIFFIDYFIELKIAKAKNQNYTPRFSLYTIISPSMVPNINVYDVIFDIKVADPATIKKGDVITFVSSSAISNGMTVTHRVTKVMKTDEGYEYFTKGDANMFEDGATAKSSNLIGKVVFKIPQLGRIQFFLSSKIGWLLCIILPALAIIVYDVLKLNKALKINNKSKNIAVDVEQPKQSSEEIKNKILSNNELLNQMHPNTVTIKQVDLPRKIDFTLPKINEVDELPKLK